MIAWFGPAVLLVLLAASQLPEAGNRGSGAVAAVLGEEFGVAVASGDPIEAQDAAAEARSLAQPLPRIPSRCRSVRGHGLPAPRPPTR